MNKYRNKDVDSFMEQLEDDLSAIVGRQCSNLGVMEILKENRQDNPELSIDEALILAMRAKGAIIMRKSIALATSVDRMVVMVTGMAEQMKDKKKAQLFLNRLKVLTDFDAIVKGLK